MEISLHNQLNALESAGLVRLVAVRPHLEYLFRHALVQEAAYASLLKGDRRELHLAVGEALERLNLDNPEELAPTLARHFEQAGAHDKAARYLTRAGEYASAVYANREAINFFRAAIEQLAQLLRSGTDEPQAWEARILELRERVGDLFELTGLHDSARENYQKALDRTVEDDRTERSRLYRKVANSWVVQREHEEAFRTFDLAESWLGREPPEPDARWWQEWLQIQLDRIWLHYVRSEVDVISALVNRVRRPLDRYGTPAQRCKFFQGLVFLAYRHDRYVVSEEALAHARAALAAARQSTDHSLIAFTQFILGFTHLWRGELDQAEEQLQAALRLSELIGDITVQSRCLTYLMMASRRRGQVSQVRNYISQSLDVAKAGQMHEYVPYATSNLAWLAWLEGDFAGVWANGQAAIDASHKLPFRMPFEWAALFPLIAVAVTEGRISEAIEYAQALLSPTQLRLPDELSATLEAAVRANDQCQLQAARDKFGRALSLAQASGYL